MRGISPFELRQLILSVGTGKSVRPLAPMAVARLIQRALDAGETRADIAERLHLVATTMIGRFTQLLSLPTEIQQMIGWRGESATIPVESAVQIARLKSTEDQITLSKALLESRLNRSDIRQVIQISQRSSNSIEKCIKAVLDQRPVIEKRHVIIGELQSAKLQEFLRQTSQLDRNNLLISALKKHLPNLSHLECKLGDSYFVLVGDECVYTAVMSLPDGFENSITDYLERESV